VKSFVIPADKKGSLEHMNIDLMNYMVRLDLAKKNVQYWDDSYAADWVFIEALIRKNIRAIFKDALIGEKC